MLTAQPERVLAASADAHDAGGGKTRPGWWGAHGGRMGGVMGGPALPPVQLLLNC